jgi:hypothetical protein
MSSKSTGTLPRLPQQAQHFVSRQVFRERRALGHVADGRAVAAIDADFDAIHDQRPCVRPNQTEDALQQRGFASRIRTDQCRHPSTRDVRVDPIQN